MTRQFVPSILARDNNNVPAFQASASAMTAGKKISITPGTPVQLVTDFTPCHHVAIYAYAGNAGYVAIGDLANVLAEPNTNNKTGQGEQLQLGAATVCHVVDASLIYMDVANSGDGVSFVVYA